MRAAVAILCLVLVAASAAPARAAVKPPVVGIGEQYASMFADPSFRSLGVRDVRYVASWNALRSDWETADLDAYLSAAHAAGVNVLLGFGHARDPARAHDLPSVKAFGREFQRFRARYPWVKDWLTWNEANHCSQPTCRTPERAAQFYLVMRRHCPGCRIVAADVLDGSRLASWVKRFQTAVGAKRRVIWGLHNYIDANRFRSTGTRALLRAVKGDVWFTETGGLVVRRNGSTVAFPGSTRHAAQATRWVFKLAALSPRVKRVYFYHWSPAPARNATWDSALVDKHDRPRPAYDVLRSWLQRHGIGD